MGETQKTEFSRTIWGLAAFVILFIVVAAAAPRLTEEADREAGRLRVFEGLTAARAIAGVAETTSADPTAVYNVVMEMKKADPAINRAFFISEGGVDDFGIATGREFVYDLLRGAGPIPDEDKALLDQATRVASTATEKGPLEVPVRELQSAGAAPEGQRLLLVFAPAMKKAADGSYEAIGVAGVLRQTEQVEIAPHFLWGVGLAAVCACAFLLLFGFMKRPRLAFATVAGVAFLIGTAGAWMNLGSGQQAVAEGQKAALVRADTALAAAAPGTKLDPALAWTVTWPEAALPVATAADGTHSIVEDVVSGRVNGRMIMPITVFFLGILLAALGIRGAANLFQGIRTQPTTYLYILPVFIAMGAVIFYPFLKGVEFAFLDAGAEEFVGLANFKDVLIPSEVGQTNFWRTLGVTVLWTVLNVVLHVSIGLSLALLLNRKHLRFKGLYRVLLVVPWAVPNYITALTWKTMFNTQYGAVNVLLQSMGIDGPNWFGPTFLTNFSANLITNVWLGFPFMMVVSLGALQSIPTDLYEAADIDGASRWQKFRKVTLPLLKPALFPAIILGTIWTFNQFNIIYLVSGGGPDHKTEILITEAYYLFKSLNQYGLAAAYCLMIFGILLAYTVMTNRITKATEGAFD